MTTTPTPQNLITATHWISIAQVVATAFVGIVAGLITWKMQSKQIDIAKGLQDIARGQHETAATKLRLELFEARFKAYEDVLACLDEICSYSGMLNIQYLDKLNKKYIKAYSPISYLFDNETYIYLKDDVSESIKNYFYALNAQRNPHSGPHIVVDDTAVDYWYSELQRAYVDLREKLGPFLQIEKEKPLIEQDDQF